MPDDRRDDDVLGRARVCDTPRLTAYYAELERVSAGALWTVANAIEPWEPVSRSVPVIWRYRELRPRVIEAAELVSTEDAARRVVMLVNPNRREVSACVGWLYTGIQIMKPGERAPAHRHMASALRLVMEGSGGYTIVDGEKTYVEPGDFVITPNGTWHDHGSEAEDGPVIWQDGLDIPLVNAMEANYYTLHPDDHQRPNRPVDASLRAFGAAGLVPAEHGWNKPYSPLLKFPWARTYEALTGFAASTDGSPYDGAIMDYVNPATGGPVMATMGAQIQMLRPGERTRAHRHTGSFCYQVMRGHGWSVIDGIRYDWAPRDIFCIPSWAVHEHANASDREDACLFSFNDLPAIRAMGLYMERAWTDNDGHQPVTGRA